jgi:uncharacterized protein
MKMKLIGFEDHFVTEDVVKAWRPLGSVLAGRSTVAVRRRRHGGRLLDLDALRLEASDQTGLRVQVLSLTAPGVQNLAPDDAVALQTASNEIDSKASGRWRRRDLRLPRRSLSGP